MNKGYRQWLAAGLLGCLPLLVAAEMAGTVLSTEGTVFVIRADGKKRIVSGGSELEKGDSLQTEKGSTAKLRFTDGSEVVVRPATTLVVQDYHFQEAAPEKDSFVLGLLRGGMRQITGFIGKRGNQDAYKLNGSTATIGIRGTDFTARVCQGDECKEKATGKTQLAGAAVVVAKVVEQNGKVTALQTNGLRRELEVGAPLYQDDLVETAAGAHASLLFVDQTRVVLPADSSLRLSQYRYVPNQPDKSNVFLDVVKGGFRMVTGLLGKQAPSKVNVGASTATIGIRGTSFDLACVPSGVSNPETYSGGGTTCGSGLFTLTREGSISVTNQNGQSMVYGAGESGYVPAPTQPPLLLRFSPEFLRSMPGPLPERIHIDIEGTFGVDNLNQATTGLYVTVSEGRVVIAQAGREMLLGAGESGFASGTSQVLQRLNTPPTFLRQDQGQTQRNLGFRSCRM